MVVRVAVAAARGRSRDIPRQTPPSAATLQRGFNHLFMTVRDARDLGQRIDWTEEMLPFTNVCNFRNVALSPSQHHTLVNAA